MLILAPYAGIGTLLAIALGIAGVKGESAFLLGMAWPATLYVMAKRLSNRGLTNFLNWAGPHTPIHQVQITIAAHSDDPDRFAFVDTPTRPE